MLLNEALMKQIDHDFSEALKYFGSYEAEVTKNLAALCGDEQYCMKFIYANAPLSDVADSSFSLLFTYVQHSLMVLEEMPWGKSIPATVFLSDVLYPRINTEPLDGSRKTLYDLTVDRIKGKSMAEAVIEVNYWCLENATYRTTDMRTSPPLTVLNRGYGRCGEESTLTVNVLRSLCIPARQIYTPRWAHCDSNHAWTEAWCDGSWYYLGACEPEPVLNKGWFDSAATRAMLLHSRTFYKNVEDPLKITDEGPISTLNRMPDYAESTPTEVVVLYKGAPVKDAKVIFEIVNFSTLTPISVLYTGDDGKARIISGLGSLLIHVVKDGVFVEKLIHTGEVDQVLIELQEAKTYEEGTGDFDTIAPIGRQTPRAPIAPDVLKAHKERFQSCSQIRKERDKSLITSSAAIKDFKPYYEKEVIEDILYKAKGNGKEIIKFLQLCESAYGYELLKILDEKDYTDLNAAILLSHVNFSLAHEKDYPKEIFLPYILNPRIFIENLTDYKPFINQFFSEAEKEDFKAHPEKIYRYIRETIEYTVEKEYDSLITSPEGVLKLKKGSPFSQAFLFVAICRSLGIPARLNPESKEIEYYDGNKFLSPVTKEELNARLHIHADASDDWVIRTNWSLSIVEDGEYKPIWLDCKPEEVKDIPLKAGHYRIITANRLPNGNIYAKQYCFALEAHKETTVEIALRHFELQDMLIHTKLNDMAFMDQRGNEQFLSQSLTDEHNILFWLEENEEPTEHILNELHENKDLYSQLDCGLYFILRDASCLQNESIQRILDGLPKIQVLVDPDFELQEPVARNLFVDPDKLPLAVLMHRDLTVSYASSGYNVGVVALLSKIATRIS